MQSLKIEIKVQQCHLIASSRQHCPLKKKDFKCLNNIYTKNFKLFSTIILLVIVLVSLC